MWRESDHGFRHNHRETSKYDVLDNWGKQLQHNAGSSSVYILLCSYSIRKIRKNFASRLRFLRAPESWTSRDLGTARTRIVHICILHLVLNKWWFLMLKYRLCRLADTIVQISGCKAHLAQQLRLSCGPAAAKCSMLWEQQRQRVDFAECALVNNRWLRQRSQQRWRAALARAWTALDGSGRVHLLATYKIAP